MPFTLTMPKLSPTMEEGVIVKWHKKTNEFAHAGDVLLEVATDKATVEYQALDEGWLRQILVEEGQEAVVNQAIAVFSIEKDESLEGYQPQGINPQLRDNQKLEAQDIQDKEDSKPETSSQKRIEGAFFQPQFLPEPPLENYIFEHPTDHLNKRILASPLAKKLAKEKGLDLSTVKGTGPNQRIMSWDLTKAQPSGLVNFGHREEPSFSAGSYEEIPLSPMRKIIGQRLQESKSFIPHFYVNQVIDAEPLVSMREQLKSQEIKLTINDFIIKACALALRQHPMVNSGYNSIHQSIVQFKTIDIAVAVSIEEGLITPIIRYADYKNLGEISLEVRALAQKAREGRLIPQEYKGGSFTISNLGMYGITEFQAILNPPQAAILAIGGIQEVPVIRNSAIIPGKILSLTLSVDHRVIDGSSAALFLQTLKKILENPAILLIN